MCTAFKHAASAAVASMLKSFVVACLLIQEQVMCTEAVHRMQHLEELKRRLQQSDRSATDSIFDRSSMCIVLAPGMSLVCFMEDR